MTKNRILTDAEIADLEEKLDLDGELDVLDVGALIESHKHLQAALRGALATSFDSPSAVP